MRNPVAFAPQLALVVVALLISVVWASAQAPAIDPHFLIGEWSGQWVDSQGGKQNGQYYMTIIRFEGDKVYGHVQIAGPTSSEFNFTGNLKGDRLVFEAQGPVEFTIDGGQMRGTSSGRMNWKISLSKTN